MNNSTKLSLQNISWREVYYLLIVKSEQCNMQIRIYWDTPQLSIVNVILFTYELEENWLISTLKKKNFDKKNMIKRTKICEVSEEKRSCNMVWYFLAFSNAVDIQTFFYLTNEKYLI